MSEEDYKRIDDYLKENMTSDERQKFEVRLSLEEDLKEEMLWQKESNQFLNRKKGRKDLKSILDKNATVFFEKTEAKVIPIHKKMWFRIAAAAATILFLLYFFLPSNDANLYDKYQTSNSLNLVNKSTDQSLALEAQNAFNQEKYELAIKNIDSYLAENQDDVTALFYKGIALQEIGRYEDAISIFSKIKNEIKGGIAEDADWQLILTYVKMGNYSKAKNLLLEISEEHNWYDKARELERELGD